MTAGATVQFTATVNGAPVTNEIWEVNGVVGGTQTVGTITQDGSYTAPSHASGAPFVINIASSVSISRSLAHAYVSIFNRQDFPFSKVTATKNPLVAAYYVAAPVGSLVEVAFGTDQDYGLTTSFQLPEPGGNTIILVAGMRANTTYHMKAILQFTDGTTLGDTDHVFTTGALMR